MKKLTTLGLLAFAGMALSAPAFAATVGGAGDGYADLVLSFRVNNSSNADAYADLEVNLGLATNFDLSSETPGNGTINLSQLSFNDLTSTYGTSYASRGDLTFSAAGVGSAGNANSDGYVTQAGVAQADNDFGNASNGIESVDRYLSGQTTTGNSTSSAVVGTSSSPATGITGSYGYYEYFGNSHQAYGFFVDAGTSSANTSDTEKVIAAGSNFLNLYYYDGSDAPVLEGTFDLNTTNNSLTYTFSDAPEPSAWAMLLGGAGLLGLAVRRRWISILG